MVYPPVIINSEIFDLLRATKYTPSVSHSLDSSLREGAGNDCGGGYHSTSRSESGRVRAIFIAPTKLRMFYISPFNRPRFLTQKRYRVGQGTYRIGTRPKRN